MNELPKNMIPIWEFFKENAKEELEISITDLCGRLQKSRHLVCKTIRELESRDMLSVSSGTIGNSRRSNRYLVLGN